jgi:hypothetical protein
MSKEFKSKIWPIQWSKLLGSPVLYPIIINHTNHNPKAHCGSQYVWEGLEPFTLGFPLNNMRKIQDINL